MKILIMGILFSLFTSNFTKVYDIKKIREDYITAINSSDKTDELYSQLSAIKSPEPILLAYLGSVQALKAKHAWNPVSKLSYLKQGFKTINAAVAKAPNEIEVRFLRYSLEYYVPSFLGFSKNLHSDKVKIIELLQKQHPIKLDIDKTILKNMIYFMVHSDECTPEELAILKKIPV
ncbi:MAG: hypothetical protein IE931_14065 [Sphingobacteriales bacterium]|nr:hypothetical protein [Sphingobacteriales bacterium]